MQMGLGFFGGKCDDGKLTVASVRIVPSLQSLRGSKLSVSLTSSRIRKTRRWMEENGSSWYLKARTQRWLALYVAKVGDPL